MKQKTPQKTLIQIEFEMFRDSLLRKAVFNNDKDSVIYLMRNGANPHSKAAHGGESALELATKEGNQKMVTLMKESTSISKLKRHDDGPKLSIYR